MKILYNQAKSETRSGLDALGVRRCYFKKLQVDRDRKSITKRAHHHTEFELHIVTDGWQRYEAEGRIYTLEKGRYLLICPNTRHTGLESAPHTSKYSLTFSLPDREMTGCFPGELTARMADNIDMITGEAALKRGLSPILIENCVLELLVSVFRALGIREGVCPAAGEESGEENALLAIAKQYIEDNVNSALSVADVAAYCYLSTKQLTRIFDGHEGIAPGEYIKKRRVRAIERLLADPTLSLRQISEQMNFSSEYYFNSFFKRHAGLPPGAYRKMLGK